MMSSHNQEQLVRSRVQILMVNLNIALGSLNIGYVVTYLTLSIDTLFAVLDINEEEKTEKLSLLAGILPLGNVVGVFVGYLLKQKFTNKQCLHIADLIGITSLLAVISNYYLIVVIRFILGVSNGISSYLMPVYIKSICPQQYFGQFSMFIGYGINTGYAIGQLMGIGYIEYSGPSSNWWRVVFLFPTVICVIRSCIMHFLYNYDSPEQLIKRGNLEQAKYVICQIYKDQYVDEQFERYKILAAQLQLQNNQSFYHIFERKKLITLQTGIISVFLQIWCGVFAVFYYSAQIFSDMTNDDVVQKTIYTCCLGLSGFVSQFFTICMVNKLGNKYILSIKFYYSKVIGSFVIGSLNLAVSILSKHASEGNDVTIFVLLLLLIMTFGSTLGPAAWSIVPQLNDCEGTFLATELRWAFQAIVVFCYPFMEKNLNIFGSFLLFAIIDYMYFIYCHFFLIDGRGKTNNELIAAYHKKFSYPVVPITNEQSENLQSDLQSRQNLQQPNQQQGNFTNQREL
ncbi:unnamed protein product (macronuclear) [Paramecium tetraurelia]|uniref:Hexose transporter 1 n=1 Tax=Paramecium tetraurelia TaxID=5888 RepID=A0BR30_PARTE|nr:uncharacterized protein GSPATT00031226001 [Paramecium tetraurelia]CAK60997.1 unnamed protein product [Paramecium tetraurelia]|eukprot:XP_001428395.1 hypothetical protein (macronuclear) [Paramecium tetraurelia strain d4-2]